MRFDRSNHRSNRGIENYAENTKGRRWRAECKATAQAWTTPTATATPKPTPTRTTLESKAARAPASARTTTDDDSDSNSCGYDDGRYDIDEDDVSSVDYEDESISEEENQVFRRYLKQIKISRGFDVDIFPKRVIGGLRPVDINADFDEVNKCAEFAIKWHNRKKTEQLEFVKPLKAIEGSTSGYMYFITLEAKVISSGKTKIYQAQVQDNFLSKKMILHIFRPKPGHT